LPRNTLMKHLLWPQTWLPGSCSQSRFAAPLPKGCISAASAEEPGSILSTSGHGYPVRGFAMPSCCPAMRQGSHMRSTPCPGMAGTSCRTCGHTKRFPHGRRSPV
jgi:hypothetical protein